MSFTNPPEGKNPEESNPENKGATQCVSLFLSNDQETPCPERHEHDWRSEVVCHLTGKLFPHEHVAKQYSV
jgi:hypothetical protein